MKKQKFFEAVRNAYFYEHAGLQKRDEYVEKQNRIKSGDLKLVKMISAFGRDFNAIGTTPNTTVAYFNTIEKLQDFNEIYPEKALLGARNFIRAAERLINDMPPTELPLNEKEEFLFNRFKQMNLESDALFWDDRGRTVLSAKPYIELEPTPIQARAITINVGPTHRFLGIYPTTITREDKEYIIVDKREFVKQYDLVDNELSEEEASKLYELVIVVETDGTVDVINNTLANSPEQRIYVNAKKQPYA